MTKELVDGQERFDGYPVVLYDGKFSGSFDLPEDVGAGLQYDDVVTFVVTCHVGKASIDATRLGDMKRTNAFPVQQVVPLSAQQAQDLYNELGVDATGQLSGQLELQPEPALDDVFVDLDEDEEEFVDPAAPVDEEEIFSPGGGGAADWEFDATPVRPGTAPANFVDQEPQGDKSLAAFLEEDSGALISS